MAIQVYDMGLDFTKGEGTSISDFRLKQAQANQADATANNYRAETDAAAKASAADEQKRGWLTGSIESSKGEDGQVNQEKAMDTYGGALLAGGYMEDYQGLQKSRSEENKRVNEVQAQEQKERDQDLLPIAHNSNIGQIKLSSKMFRQVGKDDKADFLDNYLKENEARLSQMSPEDSTKEIRDTVLSIMSPELKKSVLKDLNDKVVETNVLAPPQELFKGVSASEEYKDAGLRDRQDITQAGLDKRADQRSKDYKLRTDQMYDLQKKKLERQAIKGTKAERKEADKIKFRLRSGRNALKALDRLYLNAEQNPSAINSIFSDIISGVDRVLGSYKPGLNQEGAPLARFEADTALVAALSADLLGGRMNSKFGQERLEKALGAALTGDINNTRDQLDIMTSIIAEETGLPLPPGVLERLIKTGDYNAQGNYIGVWSNEEEVSDKKSEEVTSEMIEADYDRYKELLLRDSQ